MGRFVFKGRLALAAFVNDHKLQFVAGTYIQAPVINSTGLDGGYDFALTFSPIAPAQLDLRSRRQALGLKLVEQKRPVSVLVIAMSRKRRPRTDIESSALK